MGYTYYFHTRSLLQFRARLFDRSNLHVCLIAVAVVASRLGSAHYDLSLIMTSRLNTCACCVETQNAVTVSRETLSLYHDHGSLFSSNAQPVELCSKINEPMVAVV